MTSLKIEKIMNCVCQNKSRKVVLTAATLKIWNNNNNLNLYLHKQVSFFNLNKLQIHHCWQIWNFFCHHHLKYQMDIFSRLYRLMINIYEIGSKLLSLIRFEAHFEGWFIRWSYNVLWFEIRALTWNFSPTYFINSDGNGD